MEREWVRSVATHCKPPRAFFFKQCEACGQRRARNLMDGNEQFPEAAPRHIPSPRISRLSPFRTRLGSNNPRQTSPFLNVLEV